MHRIAGRLEETDIRALAGYLGSLPAPGNAAPEPRNVVRMPLTCGSQR
jgi:cytochrome c553